MAGSNTKKPPLIHDPSPAGFSINFFTLLDVSKIREPYFSGGLTVISEAYL